jgi:hypothetical protein
MPATKAIAAAIATAMLNSFNTGHSPRRRFSQNAPDLVDRCPSDPKAR